MASKNFSVSTSGSKVTGTLTDKLPCNPVTLGTQGLQAIGPRVTFNFITDPWSSDNTYSYYDVVKNSGNTYIARKYVPEEIDISNTDYWVLWAEPNAQYQELYDIVITYGDRITSTENNVTEILTQIDGLDVTLNEFQTAISNLENKVDTNTDNISNLENKVDTNTDNISNLENKVDTNTDNISNLESTITDLGKLENTVGTIPAQVYLPYSGILQENNKSMVYPLFGTGIHSHPMSKDSIGLEMSILTGWLNNKNKIIYGNDDPFRIDISNGYDNPKYIYPGTNSNGQYKCDCAVFSQMIANGISYNYSPYDGITENNSNFLRSDYGRCFQYLNPNTFRYFTYGTNNENINNAGRMLTHQWAKFLADNGALIMSEDGINGNYGSMPTPGSHIFFGNEDSYPNQFLGIYHCAICIASWRDSNSNIQILYMDCSSRDSSTGIGFGIFSSVSDYNTSSVYSYSTFKGFYNPAYVMPSFETVAVYENERTAGTYNSSVSVGGIFELTNGSNAQTVTIEAYEDSEHTIPICTITKSVIAYEQFIIPLPIFRLSITCTENCTTRIVGYRN